MNEARSCGCDAAERTPREVAPAPFQDSISVRIGDHSSFLGTMTAAIAGTPHLAGLTTRDPGDPAIALMDAWAVVLDTLTFYQDRIVNEGFVGTATERLSLMELGRQIDYRLAPGVSAETWLAYTTDEIPGSPTEVTIPERAIVQSIPTEAGALPQTFETDAAILARSAFNDMRLELAQYVAPRDGDRVIHLDVATARLAPGDALVLLGDERIASATSRRWQVRRVLSAEAIPEDPVSRQPSRMRVTLEHPFEEAVGSSNRIPSLGLRLFVFRRRVSLFGHNAQPWVTLPISLRIGEAPPRIELAAEAAKAFEMAARVQPEAAILAEGDAFRVSEPPVAFEGRYAQALPQKLLDELDFYPASNFSLIRGPFADRQTTWAEATLPPSDPFVYLDQVYDDIVAGAWLVLRQAVTGGTEEELFRVSEVAEVSHSDFNLTAKVTRLRLEGTGLDRFSPRSATVYAASEAVGWARRPIRAPAAGLTLRLAKPVEGLKEGQVVAIRGEAADGSGPVGLIRTIEAVATVPAQGNPQMQQTVAQTTEITFTRAIEPPLAADSVRINANVAPASHGQTRVEAIGSGNAALAFQRIDLPGAPLAHVSATNATGRRSTLELRVNDILLEERRDLLGAGPRDRVFSSQIDTEGTVTLSFGDGLTGARLPTGDANVTAQYRVGGGLAGLLEAETLTQPLTRPVGLRGVTNPAPTTGAEDPESLEAARANAPSTVTTLGRIVSLKDYEDFARTFGGIAKASVTPLWDGRRMVAHLTISGAGGQVLGPVDTVYQNLVTAIDAARPRSQPIRIDPAEIVGFALDAALWLAPEYEAETVREEVRALLLAAFTFAARGFAEPVAASDVLTRIQGVPGVLGARLDGFHRLPRVASEPAAAPLLLAQPARFEAGAFRRAEMLVLDPAQLTVREVAP